MTNRPAAEHTAATGHSSPQRLPARTLAIGLALAALAGLMITWHVLVLNPDGQRLDGAAVDGATAGQATLWFAAAAVLDVVSTEFIVAAMGVIVIVALLRRRWGAAIQAVVLIGGANLTTQFLKHALLERPDYGITTGTLNSLPSGHTTVAASVAMAVLLVVPRNARPVVAAIGAAYTCATGIATLVGQWHRPSDVIAAVLVVLGWTGLVCAFTRRSTHRTYRPASRIALMLAVGVLGGLGVLAAIAGWAVLAGANLPIIGPATASNPEVRAYVGTAALVAATSFLSFLAGLFVHEATARP